MARWLVTIAFLAAVLSLAGMGLGGGAFDGIPFLFSFCGLLVFFLQQRLNSGFLWGAMGLFGLCLLSADALAAIFYLASSFLLWLRFRGALVEKWAPLVIVSLCAFAVSVPHPELFYRMVIR